MIIDILLLILATIIALLIGMVIVYLLNLKLQWWDDNSPIKQNKK